MVSLPSLLRLRWDWGAFLRYPFWFTKAHYVIGRLLQPVFSTAMMNEMTAVGGLILMAIAISSLLEIKKIRTGSFLPALLITPLIAWLLERFFGGL